MSGVRLRVLFPEVAGRDCEHCKVYVYDDKHGGVVTQRNGQPIRRSPRHKPPCMTPGESCPKGAPEASKDFTPQNWQAYFHFLRCEATHGFPNESRVQRNAGLIAYAREQAEISRRWTAQRRMELLGEHVAEMIGLSVRARLS